MAKLLSFQKLFQKDHENFIGVAKGAKEGELIITYNSNMVMLEEVKMQTIGLVSQDLNFLFSVIPDKKSKKNQDLDDRKQAGAESNRLL